MFSLTLPVNARRAAYVVDPPGGERLIQKHADQLVKLIA
jgi:hypothetical protein